MNIRYEIAYLIMAHDNFNHIKNLITSLGKDNLYLIHLDKKSNLSDLKNELQNLNNVIFIDDRINVKWGTYTIVLAELKLMKKSLEYDYNRAILLSGYDYLIKPVPFIEEFFYENDREYIETMYLGEGGWKNKASWYQKYYYPYLNIMGSKFVKFIYKKLMGLLPKRVVVNGMIPHGGSAWWNLSKNAIEYIVKYIDNHKNVLRFYKYTNCPDEMIFQTILRNSIFESKIENNNLRFIDWDVKGSSPAILELKHFDSINESGALFARKFDSLKSKSLYEKIRANII